MEQIARVLIGRSRICAHLDVSKRVFYELVNFGLPVVVINNRWVSHTDTINDWFLGMISAAPAVRVDVESGEVKEVASIGLENYKE